ncbi:MAG: 2-dehydropantoate 2-reductase [Anaerolineae bacterium]|nr:2-dehydropantoate 2-reductase [Anaerolineae bacterium]
MRIAIIGAGALGTALAGLLRIAADSESMPDPMDIWLIGSASVAAHLDAIKTHGLALELADYLPPQLSAAFVSRLTAPITTLHVTDDPREAEPCELAIVLVKSYRSEEAGAQAAQLLAADGLVISLQNGIGNDALLTKHIPAERLILGTTLLGAAATGAGQIKIASLNPTTLAWPPHLTERQQAYLRRLQRFFALAHASLTFAEDVERTLWTKLLINCAINPLTALLNIPNGVLVETPAAHAIMRDVVREVLSVAPAVGVDLPYTVDEALALADTAAISNRANISSMLQDRRRGKRTEIDALNGAVARIAHEHGVSVPINETLARLIHALETSAAVQVTLSDG